MWSLDNKQTCFRFMRSSAVASSEPRVMPASFISCLTLPLQVFFGSFNSGLFSGTSEQFLLDVLPLPQMTRLWTLFFRVQLYRLNHWLKACIGLRNIPNPLNPHILSQTHVQSSSLSVINLCSCKSSFSKRIYQISFHQQCLLLTQCKQ